MMRAIAAISILIGLMTIGVCLVAFILLEDRIRVGIVFVCGIIPLAFGLRPWRRQLRDLLIGP
jgi:hypothetical protein